MSLCEYYSAANRDQRQRIELQIIWICVPRDGICLPRDGMQRYAKRFMNKRFISDHPVYGDHETYAAFKAEVNELLLLIRAEEPKTRVTLKDTTYETVAYWVPTATEIQNEFIQMNDTYLKNAFEIGLDVAGIELNLPRTFFRQEILPFMVHSKNGRP
jgi:hypothetical protein